MATICYAWDDAPFKWMETPFTWAEGCIIEKLIVGGAGGMQSIRRFRERVIQLSNEDKKVLINLFIRLEVDEIVFERKVNKNKNTKVKLRLKDIEITKGVQKNIKVNVNLKDKDIY